MRTSNKLNDVLARQQSYGVRDIALIVAAALGLLLSSWALASQMSKSPTAQRPAITAQSQNS